MSEDTADTSTPSTADVQQPKETSKTTAEKALALARDCIAATRARLDELGSELERAKAAARDAESRKFAARNDAEAFHKAAADAQRFKFEIERIALQVSDAEAELLPHFAAEKDAETQLRIQEFYEYSPSLDKAMVTAAVSFAALVAARDRLKRLLAGAEAREKEVPKDMRDSIDTTSMRDAHEALKAFAPAESVSLGKRIPPRLRRPLVAAIFNQMKEPVTTQYGDVVSLIDDLVYLNYRARIANLDNSSEK